jgi:hypothetical protein
VNQDGPNVELDGFGLYLLAAAKAGVAPMDGVVAPLEAAIGPDGLVHADSSIWERHWNGKQRRFLYSSIAASSGATTPSMGATPAFAAASR